MRQYKRLSSRLYKVYGFAIAPDDLRDIIEGDRWDREEIVGRYPYIRYNAVKCTCGLDGCITELMYATLPDGREVDLLDVLYCRLNGLKYPPPR